MENSFYVARLRISKLEKSDEGKEMGLRVVNDVGATNFTIILDPIPINAFHEAEGTIR